MLLGPYLVFAAAWVLTKEQLPWTQVSTELTNHLSYSKVLTCVEGLFESFPQLLVQSTVFYIKTKRGQAEPFFGVIPYSVGFAVSAAFSISGVVMALGRFYFDYDEIKTVLTSFNKDVTEANVNIGTIVHLHPSEELMRSAFDTSRYVWHDAMRVILNTDQEVVERPEPGIFGLVSCIKDDPRQPVWYYPFVTIQGVFPEERSIEAIAADLGGNYRTAGVEPFGPYGGGPQDYRF